jgi:NAD(P)-dependent dehydrogenase (short-subunit alcohol dehydrogenase family)
MEAWPAPASLLPVSNPVIVVVGAGQGIGASVARRFGGAGYDVALIARGLPHLEELGAGLQHEGMKVGWASVDVTDAEALTAAVARFGRRSGSIQHLHFNPSVYTPKPPLELSAAELLRDLHLGAASLLTAAQAARPFLAQGSRITATGGGSADHPSAAAASLGAQKAALRNLVTALDSQLKRDGIRAMSLTVAGTVKDGTPFAPERIADAFFAAAQTADDDWRTEIRYTGASD